MPSQGDYSVVVDVDDEGDLGELEYNADLEFHNSNFNAPSSSAPASTPKQNVAAGKHHIFHLPFYAQFFNLDTSDLIQRCRAALYPRESFLDAIDGNPDLYGPVWITTSVVLILFLAGTLQSFFAGGRIGGGKYDFRMLTAAAGLMYGYSSIVPVALWGALRWFGSEAGSVLECLCLYGYANLVWIPVAIASISTLDILNYIFAALGFGLSAFFLFRNLFPIVSSTDQKTAKILLILVLLAHAGFAITIKILFFQHKSPVSKDKPT